MAVDLLACLALGWFGVVWSICLLGLHVACVASVPGARTFSMLLSRRTRYARPPPALPQLDDADAPGVTILRPLCGLDDNLHDNLECSFTQDYPRYELLFCVAHDRDPALPIVRGLMERFPAVDARIVIAGPDVGANPKINNLSRAYKEAKHDIVWILDSNVLVTAGTLRRSVAALERPGVGLVHHVPFALFPTLDWGARLDQCFLNATHAKMYLAINAVAVDSCLMGKSNLFRRSDLARAVPLYRPLVRAGRTAGDKAAAGLDAFACYLGEDNMIGSALWHGGKLKHAMTPDVAGNAVGGMSLRAYWWRRVRWIRIRRTMTVAATLLEPLTESAVVGCLGAFALRRLLGLPAPLVFLLNAVAWYRVDVAVFAALLRASPCATPARAAHELPRGLAFLQAWLLREALALPIWLVAMLGGATLTWRGDDRQYRLHLDGTVTLERREGIAPPLG